MKKVIPFILLLVVVVAVVASVAAYHYKGPDNIETWLVVTAALAVISGALGTFSCHRMAEMQEHERQPEVELDLRPVDLAGSMVLTMVNVGRLAAYDVEVTWSSPRPTEGGGPIVHTASSLRPALPQTVRLSPEFNRQSGQSEYRATIIWTNRNGDKFTGFFKVTGTDLEAVGLAEAERRQSDRNVGNIAQLQRSVAETNRRMQNPERDAKAFVRDFARGIRSHRR